MKKSEIYEPAPMECYEYPDIECPVCGKMIPEDKFEYFHMEEHAGYLEQSHWDKKLGGYRDAWQ